MRRRLALGGLAGLAVLAASTILLGGLALWHTLPPDRETLRIPSLTGPVSIALDKHGVPHVRATSFADAAAALGVLHARDRMFQMELMRRVGSGRVAELAGPAGLPIDREMRVLGLRHLAEAALPNLPAPVRAELDAYASGVNAELAARGRFIAPEFLLLGRPEPWTAADSLLWGRLMALSLAGNWRTELARLADSRRQPLDRLLSLWPPEAGTPAPSAESLPLHGALALAAAIPRFPAPWTLPEEESDEWAVDADHSVTGAPLLAGDPHLSLSFPAIWYLARLDITPPNGPAYALAGATAPGVPFLVIGQNGHIAWSFTSSSIDTEDLFRETVLSDGRYATPNGPRRFAVRSEVIHVRGAPDQLLRIRSTRHGPVLSDVLPPEPGAPVLAAAMENLQPTDAAPGLSELNRALSVADAGRAAAAITTPVQNLLVADRSAIALFTTGIVPVRRSGDGSAPVDGASSAFDWVGARSGPALPTIVSPSTGQLLNGNERTASPDFPVFLGRDWPAPWRADRIRTLLAGRPKHDLAEFAAMQVDTGSAFARTVLPMLLNRPLALRPSEPAARALVLLRGWSGSMDADAPQPLIFNAWLQRFAAIVIARNRIDGATPPWEDLVSLLLSRSGVTWCGGDCSPLLRTALRDAVTTISNAQGPDPATWRWDRVHRAVFVNDFLEQIPLVRRLATGSVPVPGDDSTLFRGGNGVLGDFTARHGGAYRGDYDLAAPDHSRFMLAPGQSGNWLSPLAWNLMHDWAHGITMTLPRDPGRASAVIELTP